MAELKHIFIDDGGVMNDNAVRGLQWQALVAEFFPPRLGGEPGAWAEANRVAVPVLWQHYPSLIGNQHAGHFLEEHTRYEVEWLQVMADHVGVPLPEASDLRLALAREAAIYVTSRVRSAFPGAVNAIRALADAGFILHTASGEVSWELDGYLRGMKVREHFRTLYGPDLVGLSKSGPQYYRAIFEHADVDPATALVIDDSPRVMGWVSEEGAAALLVDSEVSPAEGVVRSLADAPGWLRGLASSR